MSFFPRVRFFGFRLFFTSLSLFSLEKERERGGQTGKEAIHGFLDLLKKASTGLSGDPRVFGGLFFKQNPMVTRTYVRFDLNPRIHGLKCPYVPGEVRNGG